MFIKLVFLIVLTLALPGTVFAQTLNWDSHGVCQEYSGGRIVGRADAEQCREIVGSNYNWDRSGTCFEWTPGGAKVGRADMEDCRESAGSHYKLDSSGACYELTPLNIKIQLVRTHYCTDGGDFGGDGYRQEPIGPGGDMPGGPLGDSDEGNGTLQPDSPAIVIEPQQPATPPRPRPPGPLRVGYNWSDANHTMCILYSSTGYALHMAPPASCKK